MIRRPLDPSFADAVRSGAKTTTIRTSAWPIGVPILLYSWSGAPYRSTQKDEAIVRVTSVAPITICHETEGSVSYSTRSVPLRASYATEGFASQREMDEWFRRVVRRGHFAFKNMMTFTLYP